MNTHANTGGDWPNLRYAWFVVIVLMTLYIFSFIDRMIIALLVTPIKADLSLTDTDIGLLHGLAFALFYTFCRCFYCAPGGQLESNKIGRHRRSVVGHSDGRLRTCRQFRDLVHCTDFCWRR